MTLIQGAGDFDPLPGRQISPPTTDIFGSKRAMNLTIDQCFRAYQNVGRAGAIGYMQIIRRGAASSHNQSLREMMREPEFRKHWTAWKDKQTTSAFERLHPIIGGGQALRLSALFGGAIEAEAERVFKLDDQGRFDPDNLDPRSRRILGAAVAQSETADMDPSEDVSARATFALSQVAG